MTDREAMKMAFNALLLAAHTTRITTVLAMCAEATDALRQALAQPEQKLIGWKDGEPQYIEQPEQTKYSDIVSDGGLDPRNKFDAQQEPVAWMLPDYGDVLSASEADGTGIYNIPLYTAPPKREWVGLTDEERDLIARDAAKNDWHDYIVISATEAVLRSKNNG